MKKKLFASSGVLLIALVITGLWASKAISFTDGGNTIDQASATSLDPRMSLQQMVEESPLIVIGTCVGTTSQWVDRNLFTVATFSVSETIKGNPVPVVKVVSPGGIDSNRRFPIAVTVPAAPQFSTDGENFLFLTDAQDQVAGGYAVVGFNQGNLPIANADGGGKVITADATRALVQTGAGMKRGTLLNIPLQEFKAEVLRHLAQ